MAANQTNIKNTEIDTPRYEKSNKDNKEWFHEECRQLLEQTNKAKAGIFSLTNESREQNMQRKGNGRTRHVKKKDAGYQPTINCNRSGIYGEKPKTSIQDGRKDKRRIKPHTNLCKDK